MSADLPARDAALTTVLEHLKKRRRNAWIVATIWSVLGGLAIAALVFVPGDDDRTGIVGLTAAILVVPPVLWGLWMARHPSHAHPFIALLRDKTSRLSLSYVSIGGRGVHDIEVKLTGAGGQRASLMLPKGTATLFKQG